MAYRGIILDIVDPVTAKVRHLSYAPKAGYVTIRLAYYPDQFSVSYGIWGKILRIQRKVARFMIKKGLGSFWVEHLFEGGTVEVPIDAIRKFNVGDRIKLISSISLDEDCNSHEDYMLFTTTSPSGNTISDLRSINMP